jgi:hypothetical protein
MIRKPAIAGEGLGDTRRARAPHASKSSTS